MSPARRQIGSSMPRPLRRPLIAALACAALLGGGFAATGWMGGAADPTLAQADTGPSVTLSVSSPSTGGPANVLTSEIDLKVTTSAAVVSTNFEYSPAGQNQWISLQTVGAPVPTILSIDDESFPNFPPDGLYDFRAVVTDAAGNSLVSPTVGNLLVANDSPVVILANPGSVLSGRVSLSATDESGDPNATLLDGATVSFESSPSGQNTWTPIAGYGAVSANSAGAFTASFDTTAAHDGLYDLRVVVTDGDGNTDYSIPVTGVLVDNTAPTVTLAAPSAPLSGQVDISATAADSGSGVARVDFQYAAHGSDVWKEIGTATVAPYAAVLNTLPLANGDYDLRALAFDAAGNQATSAVIGPVSVYNTPQGAAVTASITGELAPATSIGMLGTITQSPLVGSQSEDGETWAYGFTSAPPAQVGTSRLPYTAEGDQLVLLRYVDGSGWQVADVLRGSNGSPFELLPPDDVASTYVTGAMTATGEAWIALTERPTQSSGKAPVVGLFHRSPGGQFELDPELDPTSSSYDSALAAILSANTGGTALRLGSTQGRSPYGVLTAPDDLQQVSVTASGGAAVTINEALRYALLENGSWTVRTASLPASYTPLAGDTVRLTDADVSGPDSGWGTLGLAPRAHSSTPELMLGQFSPGDSGIQWSFTAKGLPASLTGPLADPPNATAATTPQALRVFGNEVWVKASVALTPTTNGGLGGETYTVVSLVNASTGTVTNSWCSLPVGQCNVALGDADVPDWASQGSPEVGLALDSNRIDIYADDAWSEVPAPGYSGGENADTFTGANSGWLAGADAVGQWTSQTSTSPLVSWPLPDRTPLTAVAAPAGQDDTSEPQVLAVGLDGTTLYYDNADGWLPATLPTTWQFAQPPAEASHINLLGVAFDGATDAFAVGQYGAILRWDGSEWSEDPQSFALTEEQLNAVAFAPSGQGWAVGANGTILHYNGQSWSIQAPPAVDAGVDITSVTVAGSTVYAVAGGNLITLATAGSSATGATGATGSSSAAGGDSWQDVPASDLPGNPAPTAGALRLVAGLSDGGVMAAGVNELLVSEASGEPFAYSTQPLQGIAVALAPFRQSDGDLGAFVSVAPPAASLDDVGGFPAGDGELMRFTDSGWQDLSQAQYAGVASGDGAVKADPVLGVASDSTGEHAWAVGGYAGTLSASGLGTNTVLAARSTGWYTASIWRYDSTPSPAPPQLSAASVNLPAQSNTVSFAFFSSPECRSECSAVLDAQPDVNLSAAATQIAAYAAQPGGPAFAVLGGNDRGPLQPSGGYDASAEYDQIPSLLSPLGNLPLYGVLGPQDNINLAEDPALTDPLAPWASAFAESPPPLGAGAAASGITPISSGGAEGGGINVNRYYAFDAAQNGGTLRVIVLDNSQGSLEASDPGQTAWLQAQLAAGQAANLPMVVFVAEPLRPTDGGASDGSAVAAMLADAGVLAVFTTSPSQLNQHHMVPADAGPGAPQIPEYEGASLGYQQTANNGVDWYFVSVNTSTRTVSLNAVPLVSSIALEPLDGLTVARSVTLQFDAIARRPSGTLATYATGTGDDGFPGFDQYVQIPAASCGSSPCITPTYSFTSSDPTIGTFVQASGPGSPYPALNSAGDPIPDAQSGLFCAYNSGTTTVSVTAGLFSYSLPVTVLPGEFGAPCGTVYRAGVGKVEIVIGPSAAGQDANPGANAPPPPPSSSPPVATQTAPVVVPVPHAPVASHVAKTPTPPKPVTVVQPAPAPTVVPAASPSPSPPIAVVPPPPTPVQPTPPGGSPVPAGGVAQSPATARREEKARKHASQSAFTIRPAGTSTSDWLYGAVGAASVLVMLLAASALRPPSGLRPAPARSNVRRPAGQANAKPRRRP
jgi:hypothetical protein